MFEIGIEGIETPCVLESPMKVTLTVWFASRSDWPGNVTGNVGHLLMVTVKPLSWTLETRQRLLKLVSCENSSLTTSLICKGTPRSVRLIKTLTVIALCCPSGINASAVTVRSSVLLNVLRVPPAGIVGPPWCTCGQAASGITTVRNLDPSGRGLGLEKAAMLVRSGVCCT